MYCFDRILVRQTHTYTHMFIYIYIYIILIDECKCEKLQEKMVDATSAEQVYNPPPKKKIT